MLRSLVRAYDLVGRYGGEEFIVVAQQSSEAGAYEYADRLRAALSESTVTFADSSIAITVSIGAAFNSDLAGCTPDSMVRSADQALYDAKARGRNCVVVDTMNSSCPLPCSGPLALELR